MLIQPAIYKRPRVPVAAAMFLLVIMAIIILIYQRIAVVCRRVRLLIITLLPSSMV